MQVYDKVYTKLVELISITTVLHFILYSANENLSWCNTSSQLNNYTIVMDCELSDEIRFSVLVTIKPGLWKTEELCKWPLHWRWLLSEYQEPCTCQGGFQSSSSRPRPLTSCSRDIAPVTSCPTTLCPTTLCPTKLCPTTLCPTTLCPTTLCPTTLCPTTLCPTTLCPTTLCPTTLCPTKLCPTELGPTDFLTSCSSALPVLNRSPVGKVKNLFFEYFRILREGSDVFFDADSEWQNHPTWRRVKMQPWGVVGEKLLLWRSCDQCVANWCTNLKCSLLG